MHDLAFYPLGLLSGGLVGLTLSLVGGGGSILAVPLMVYVVGVPNPHVAIGTAAFAVATNAATGLYHHARSGNVNWRCGLVFAAVGATSALAGSSLGKAFDGQKLLFLFAGLMLIVAARMGRQSPAFGDQSVSCDRRNLPRLGGVALATGMFAGFFGIGGGFLIVPGLIFATGMSMLTAVGSSLIAVTGFGLTTAANYAWSGFVSWQLAFVFIAGGAVGGFAGAALAKRLSRTGALPRVFAMLIAATACYMLWKSANQLF